MSELDGVFDALGDKSGILRRAVDRTEAERWDSLVAAVQKRRHDSRWTSEARLYNLILGDIFAARGTR